MTTLAACDTHNPTLGANPRQVTVVGSGQVQGVPDTLTADVGIEFSAPDVTAAMNQTNDRQQAVINALVGAGVDRKDINTTQVTLQPQYGSPEPTITGYRATNAIQVKIHPTDAASRMLALIVSTGGDATRITSVSYSIADDSQLVKDARARAFNDAKSRAVRPAVRATPGQDAVDLGDDRECAHDGGHRHRPRPWPRRYPWSRASRRSASR